MPEPLPFLVGLQDEITSLNDKAISSIKEVLESNLNSENKIAAIHYLTDRCLEYSSSLISPMNMATSWQAPQ